MYYIYFQYIDGLVTDFDLIVLGGYLDRSRKCLKKFLVGVYDKLPESGTFFFIHFFIKLLLINMNIN